MAVAEFQGQHYKPADLSKFSDSCHVDASVDKTIGGNKPPTPGVEAELDIEYMKGSLGRIEQMVTRKRE